MILTWACHGLFCLSFLQYIHFYGLYLFEYCSFLLEYAWKCYYCQRSLAQTWRSYSSFKCNGMPTYFYYYEEYYLLFKLQWIPLLKCFFVSYYPGLIRIHKPNRIYVAWLWLGIHYLLDSVYLAQNNADLLVCSFPVVHGSCYTYWQIQWKRWLLAQCLWNW